MVKHFDLAENRAGKPQKRGQKRGRPKNQLDGWLILDKPIGMTSTQALGAVKRILQPAKAGHAGTLDPLATGMLPLAFGEATKTVPFVVDGTKRYRFTATFGAETDTDDADGTVIATSDVRPDAAAIEGALAAFTGDIFQTPPKFSAIKINGQRAYDLAREGAEVEIKPRPVRIDSLTLLSFDGQNAVLEAVCGKGTYVRALARDLARALGTAGHVTALRRTAVGPFGERDMVTLEALRAGINDPQALVDAHLRAPGDGLSTLEAVVVDKVAAARLRQGQSALLRPLRAVEGPVRATEGGHTVALCTVEEGALHPTRVIKPARRRITVMPTPPTPPAEPAEPAEGDAPAA
ncbi:MAG: tRNA pseudouridine(55) synthase TruB [Pseudomonadota bacterium]